MSNTSRLKNVRKIVKEFQKESLYGIGTGRQKASASSSSSSSGGGCCCCCCCSGASDLNK